MEGKREGILLFLDFLIIFSGGVDFSFFHVARPKWRKSA